jgi:hypothetical protein
VFLNIITILTQYTLQRQTVVPRLSTVYFVALAFHLILGIDPRTRTLTDSFGDCSAAITLGGCIILVEQRGFEPLQNLLTSGLQPGALPLRRLLHKIVSVVRNHLHTYAS